MVLIHGDGNIGYLKEINLVKNRDLNAPLLPEVNDLKFSLILVLLPAEGLFDMKEVSKSLP